MKDQLEYTASDPLSQALVLTAIVISFGLVAFLLVLVAQLYWKTGSDDSDSVSPENS
jgi:multicomponent Na+:H+ antiporter subunit C